MRSVIERILNLLAFLLTVERPVTAEEIRMTVAGYDQVSDDAWRRMFERDKDLLRSLGIPLELRPTDVWEVEDGYVVPAEDYSLPDPGLTDEEQAALWLASNVVRLGGGAPGAAALFKLGGSPLAAAGEPLAADLGRNTSGLAEVFLALSERRMIRFGYRGRPRRVAPYGLVHRRGHWYVVGAEEPGSTVKVFRMDRAEELEATGKRDAFTPPEGFRASDEIPEAPWEAGGDDLEAIVEFDPSIAWWARRQLTGRSAVITRPDGGLTATLQVANPDAFIGWLIAFEDAAEVLEPQELRDRIVARIEGRS